MLIINHIPLFHRNITLSWHTYDLFGTSLVSLSLQLIRKCLKLYTYDIVLCLDNFGPLPAPKLNPFAGH